MNEETKYCKFCGKEKPIKYFVKSGFCVKNICKDCNNKKRKEVYKNSKNYHKLQQENQQLKEEFDRVFAVYQSRKLIKKFNDEYDEEDKTKNPNRDYACICPDVEEVYKRYYELKEQLQQKEDILDKIKDCVEEFLCSEYYCSQGLELHDFCVKILKILDNKGDENDG